MSAKVQTAFEPASKVVALDDILPLHRVDSATRKAIKYRRIAASIEQLGVIEPLVIHPQKGRSGKYMLLDGHLRHDILKEMGEKETLCLIATDDEAFTYNHKVNQISPIQEHFMILKAIESGVSEERMAATLNIDVARIRQKRDLLRGVCPEAVELLKDRPAAPNALRELKKVKPMRQIEMAELMIAAHNFSATYAKCLFAATPAEQLAVDGGRKDTLGLDHEEIARIENEMGRLGREFKLIEESYGRNVLKLVVYVGYVKRLLENPSVTRYLTQHYGDILGEFKKLVASTDLSQEL